jgi:DNA repair exonuclease SbcCD ATPase subunit
MRLFLIIALFFILHSCVSLNKYKKLEFSNSILKSTISNCEKELSDLTIVKEQLDAKLKKSIEDNLTAQSTLKASYNDLDQRYTNLLSRYNTDQATYQEFNVLLKEIKNRQNSVEESLTKIQEQATALKKIDAKLNKIDTKIQKIATATADN